MLFILCKGVMVVVDWVVGGVRRGGLELVVDTGKEASRSEQIDDT
jgi:hypothetical protein